ncbi:hypothetical protein MHI22_05425 [Lysinibacillus sp. FSL L8-0312]|uniref:hypothetical protein n=1 Tax=Lysinibacillus sp. FSL L8-0312 TaxID=2921521 RepID=UPI0030FB5718
MDKQITVTMPVEEYERLKRDEIRHEALIHSLRSCIGVQEVGNEGETQLIVITDSVVELLAPFNDWDFELEHFDKVIIRPYKG